jgi:hypothetical protein
VTPHDVVVLFDWDNTLLDNDRVQLDQETARRLPHVHAASYPSC